MSDDGCRSGEGYIWAICLTGPDGAPTLDLFVCYVGTGDAAERAVQLLEEIGTPLADSIGPMSYRQLLSMLDAAFPRELRGDSKSSYFPRYI